MAFVGIAHLPYLREQLEVAGVKCARRVKTCFSHKLKEYRLHVFCHHEFSQQRMIDSLAQRIFIQTENYGSYLDGTLSWLTARDSGLASGG
jgi:hypothetical protein